MAAAKKIRIMVSSRCNDPIAFNGKKQTLTDVRLALKADLEGERLLGSALFDVWINEDAPPEEGSTNAWDACMKRVKGADVVIVLYNGSAGWAKEGGDVGICHAELETALSTAPAKVRLVAIEPLAPLGASAAGRRDARFRAYVDAQGLFRGKEAKSGEEAILRAKQALRQSVAELAHLGVREAKKGKFSTGTALDWSHLDLAKRRRAIEETLAAALSDREGSAASPEGVIVRLADKRVLFHTSAIPAAMTMAAARAMMGRPFSRDFESVAELGDGSVGPVHVIGCHRKVSEARALKQLGNPEATVVKAPFGVYVVDDVQKIQLVFLANCRDDTMTRHGVVRFFDWLEASGELVRFANRAAARRRIVLAIARELT